MRYMWICLFASAMALYEQTDSFGTMADSVAVRDERDIRSADPRFFLALDQVGHIPVAESIQAFRQVLKTDRRYAPAHYQIAKLYMMLGTPNDHLRARKAINEAMRLEPQEMEYQLGLGDLLWAQGFRYNAEQQYHRVLKTDPDNARAAYKIGQRALKEFLKYQHMGMLGNRLYAQQDRERAEHYLERSIRLDGLLKEAYYYLGLLYIELGDNEALIALFRSFIQKFPDEADGFLFCGLGYQNLGKFKVANAFYEQAFRYMSEEAKAILEDVGYIADKLAQTGTLFAQEPGGAERGRVFDDALQRFWQSQNPLFLTNYNERKMEHYARIAYANLFFGIPEKGLAGWQTDKGKTYIKFGSPLSKSSQRPEAEISIGLIRPHLEFWQYENFRMTFINRDGLDHWTFSPTLVGFGMASVVSGETRVPLPTAHHIFKNTPVRYIDPYGKQKYQMPSHVAAFKDKDSIRVDIAYAIPVSRIRSSPDQGPEIDEGIFFFDASWNEVYRHIDRQPHVTQIKGPRREEEYFLAVRQVRIAPGDCIAVLEVGDRLGGSVGQRRLARRYAFQDSLLDMSDLLLASRIETLKPFPIGREDLNIVPNPLLTYDGTASVFVYLEIYHLMQNAFGRTQFDIAYQLGVPRKGQADSVLFEATEVAAVHREMKMLSIQEAHDPEWDEQDELSHVTRPGYEIYYRMAKRQQKEREEEREGIVTGIFGTVISSHYEGFQSDDFTFLEIDVSQMPAGIYRLTATVRDVQTQQAAEKDVVFRIIKNGTQIK